jgi:nitroreductase
MDEKLKTFYELVERRRSVREFLEEEIEEDKVERLFGVLQRAQSAANCQPWHFIVLRKENRDRLKDVLTREGFKKAPIMIVACAEPSRAWVRKADGVNYAWVDVTIALTEMITAATAEGLGTCWVAAIDPAQVKRALEIPDPIEIVGIIVIGYPLEEFKRVEKTRKPLEDIIHHGRW